VLSQQLHLNRCVHLQHRPLGGPTLVNGRLIELLLQVVENEDASHGTFLLPQCSDWRRVILGGMTQVVTP
jgi:hypothetical protein